MFTIKIFSLFRKPVASPPKVISKLTRRARAYASENFTPPPPPQPGDSGPKYSINIPYLPPKEFPKEEKSPSVPESDAQKKNGISVGGDEASGLKSGLTSSDKKFPEDFWEQYVKASSDSQPLKQYQRRGSSEEYNPPSLKSRVSVEEKKADSRDPYSSKQADPIIKSAVEGPASKIPVTAIEKLLNRSFSQRLAELIGEKGLRDSAVYKAAGMDRRLFSKIISSKNYKPSKDTALALVFALSLTLDEAKDLLDRAGYTLSHSSRRDVILEYFIREGVTNLVDINIVLEKLGEKIIGRG